MKILCIGGPNDGEWFEDLNLPHVRIPIYRLVRPVSATAVDLTEINAVVEVARYRRETLRSGRNEIVFYVHEPMDTLVAIIRLFNCYRKP
jgi:hypothetical protein